MSNGLQVATASQSAYGRSGLTSACSRLAPAAVPSIRMIVRSGAAADAQGIGRHYSGRFNFSSPSYWRVVQNN